MSDAATDAAAPGAADRAASHSTAWLVASGWSPTRTTIPGVAGWSATF